MEVPQYWSSAEGSISQAPLVCLSHRIRLVRPERGQSTMCHDTLSLPLTHRRKVYQRLLSGSWPATSARSLLSINYSFDKWVEQSELNVKMAGWQQARLFHDDHSDNIYLVKSNFSHMFWFAWDYVTYSNLMPSLMGCTLYLLHSVSIN